MTESLIDLTGCDREPIHIPGSIQPHGIMLVVGAKDMLIRQGAGDIEGRLGAADWLGRPLAEVIGASLAQSARVLADTGRPGLVGRWGEAGAERLDVSLHLSGEAAILEFEPVVEGETTAAMLLSSLEAAGASFERSSTLKTLCDQAAAAFRTLTGFDRVMVYRFLDDEAGTVLAEAKRPDLPSFLNHHFPGSDIPRQARALYVRNLIRVIPDAAYVPAPLRPPEAAGAPLDMSDAALRSVSPIHLEYLSNMGVVASASVSIVKDGFLWGLIACHHTTPRQLSYDTRIACRVLAGGMARQIKAKEEAEGYRERIRLRGFEDEIVALLSREGTLDEALSHHIDDIRRLLSADGVAVLRGGEMLAAGTHPPESAIRDLARWISAQGDDPVFSTDRLSSIYPSAANFQKAASGVLSLMLSADEPWVIQWYRAEQVQVVEWAGNPHKDETAANGALRPRASFDAWRETVHGRSARWTLVEVEAAGRLRPAVLNVRQNRRIRELNVRLTDTLNDKDLLLQQKEFLIGEVNHRVQNSLQLVSSFLGLQARDAGDPRFQATVEEARRRLQAVALVHRRLYRGDNVEIVDAARYLEELCSDTMTTMGPEWADGLALDLAPIKLRTDRAVTLGLVLTELMINTNKYAYGGEPGPVEVRLIEDRNRMRLVVADKGVGKVGGRKGFGSRMMDALVGQLGGDLTFEDNTPGLKATLTAPIEAAS